MLQIDSTAKVLQDIEKLTTFNAYGLEWNQTDDTLRRLGKADNLSAGADFDNITPWMMKRCNLADDGTVNNFYGEAGYAEDGSNGQVMVRIPKFYYRTEKVDNGDEIYRWWISEEYQEGFEVHPAFVKGSIEKDYIYIGAYEATVYDDSAASYVGDGITYDYNNDIMASVADLQPISGDNDHLDILEARQLAENRGTGWTQQSFNAISAVQLLYLIEYADFNIQNTISEGITNLDSGSNNHSQNTGHTSTLGNDSGEVVIGTLENGASGDTETYAMSYRGIENLFGNIWNFVDGIFIKDDGYYIENDPSNWNNDGTGYTHISASPTNFGGYIDNIEYLDNMNYTFLGKSTDGGSSTELCDYQWSHDSGEVTLALVGGGWGHGLRAGCFSWHLHSVASYSHRSRGARLLFK
jgi:hypothetical protein